MNNLISIIASIVMTMLVIAAAYGFGNLEIKQLERKKKKLFPYKVKLKKATTNEELANIYNELTKNFINEKGEVLLVDTQDLNITLQRVGAKLELLKALKEKELNN